MACSILENAEKMDAPIPKNILEKTQDSNDNTNILSLQAFIFSIYGFVIWLKLYYAIISTVAHDSDKRLPHNMPDNKLLLCE